MEGKRLGGGVHGKQHLSREVPKSFIRYFFVDLASSPPVSVVQVSTVQVQFMQLLCLLAAIQLQIVWLEVHSLVNIQ